MMLRVPLVKLNSILVAVVFCSLPMLAQTVSPNLNGMAGNIRVLPNQQLAQTVVVLQSTVPIADSTSTQIAFVVQAEKGQTLPNAWSGIGRVLAGDGVLVIALEAGDSSTQPLIFKFAERTIPESVKNWHVASFTVYGIARYGEKTTLSEEQIDGLVQGGRLSQNQSLPITPSQRSNRLPGVDYASTSPEGTGPVNNICTAGGEGASQCSGGGSSCSVTCGSGYYACCNANNNNCNCVKVPQE